MKVRELLSDTRFRKWAGLLLALVAIGLIVWAVYRQWDAFSAAVTRLTWRDVVPASVFGALALLANAFSWRAAMRSLGLRLPAGASLRVFSISQLGKYVPGSVWPVLAQVELMKGRGASRSQTGTASLVAMAIGIVTSAAVGAGLVVAVDADSRARYWYVPLVAVLGLLVLLPPVLMRVLRGVELAIRRTFRPGSIAWGGMGAAIGWSIVMWALFGIHMWFLGQGLGAEGLGLLRATGAFALAWVVGFLVIFAPAGVGVREAVLVLVLAPVMSEGDALALAVISRVLLTFVDAAAGGVGVIAGRRLKRAQPPDQGVHPRVSRSGGRD